MISERLPPAQPERAAASVLVQEAESIASPAAGAGSTAPSGVETYRFPALAPVPEGGCRLPFVEFSCRTRRLHLQPGRPQLGQTWSLDQAMDVAGIPLHLVGPPGQIIRRICRSRSRSTAWSLSSIPRPLPQPERFLARNGLSRAIAMGATGTPGTRYTRVTILSEQLPQRPLQITIERARIALPGPWEIHSQIPWSGEAPPAIHAPDNPVRVEDFHVGIVLRFRKPRSTARAAW